MDVRMFDDHTFAVCGRYIGTLRATLTDRPVDQTITVNDTAADFVRLSLVAVSEGSTPAEFRRSATKMYTKIGTRLAY